MDITQLTAGLTQLGVTPPDQLRACFYLDKLRNTQTFFSQTMAQPAAPGLGNDYPFVQQAVSATNLLNELAATLDLYVGSLVNQNMQAFFVGNPNTYQYYFAQQVLNSNVNDNSIQQLLQACPITDFALQQITTNFQQNILLACQRVIQDRALIQQLFNDQYPSLTITGLKKIQSTGSDFHKGGKQVLILTFSINYYVQNVIPTWSELKVVYKPSDLEADCLLAGNSVAVNNVINNFMPTPSLVEIFNNRVRAMLAINPNLNLEELPTYCFLPRNSLSGQPAGPVPGLLRNAYGYIEYLGYELYGELFSAWNLFPLGSSDFLIFYLQNEQPIISKFYRQIGQLLALAGTFSITDMHIENVRVKSFQPSFIDLEVSLTDAIADITATALFTGSGGITGYHVNNQDYKLVVPTPNTPGSVFIQRSYEDKYYHNRLWIVRSGRNLVDVSAYWLVAGFNNGMAVMQQCQQNNDFQNWFPRLNGVLVRYLPFATPDFKAVRTNVYINTPGSNNFNAALLATIQEEILYAISDAYDAYALAATPQPDLIVWQHPQLQTDYQNLDIPVFYHRIGSQDILDSTGAQVQVLNPQPITVLNHATPRAQVPQNIATGRTTFFANVPTTINVQQGQVQALTGANFNNRVQTLVGQILNNLGLAAPPNPSVLIARW
jgi:hypothetical protein